MNSPLPKLRKKLIEAFCRKHYKTKLPVFGSNLRDNFGPESDIDILVEFDPNNVPGLLRLAGMERELSESLG